MKAIFRKRLRASAGFTLAGCVIGPLLGLIIAQIDGGPVGPHLVRSLIVGLIIGAFVGLGEEFVFAGRSRSMPYHYFNAARIALYGSSIVATLLIINSGYAWLVDGASLRDSLAGYLLGGTWDRDSLAALIVAVLGTSFLEIRRLHNPGDIRRFLLGRYRTPQAEERVFIFVDIKDSTPLGERLGDLIYSQVVAKIFYDISEAILAWKGQVYQYVGDGVIVSWPLAQGVKDATCVHCFFDMIALLETKSERYRTRYGTAPSLRAGLHGGSVVTTWVGEAKKELAFHGDTLNTTARIQGVASRLDRTLVASAWLMDQIDLQEAFKATSLGVVELKGKQLGLELCEVEANPT